MLSIEHYYPKICPLDKLSINKQSVAVLCSDITPFIHAVNCCIILYLVEIEKWELTCSGSFLARFLIALVVQRWMRPLLSPDIQIDAPNKNHTPRHDQKPGYPGIEPVGRLFTRILWVGNQDCPFDQRESESRNGAVTTSQTVGHTECQHESDPAEHQSNWNKHSCSDKAQVEKFRIRIF